MDTKLIKNIFYRENEETFSYVHYTQPKLQAFSHSHLHNSYEFLLFLEGDADYHIGGDVYHLSKNDLLIIKPTIYHNISLLSPHPYTRITLNFYEEDFSPNIIPILQNASPIYHIPEGHPILQIFESMRSSFELLSQEVFGQFFLATATSLLLLLPNLNDADIVKKNNATQSTFDNILSYIDKNPDKPLTLASLSKEFFLSESHISHLFKKKLDTSAMQYINCKKISYAHSLLIAGIPPVQVAEKCSFDNYSTFYRLYKKFFGTAPKNYDK